MKVLVCGSRHYTDWYSSRESLDKCTEDFEVTHVISGGAKGADKLGEEWAILNGIPVSIYPADWDKYGKGAGPIRNKQMLDEGKPDLVVAFLAPDSRGTKNMIEQATEAGVPVKVINIGEVNG